MKKLLTLCVSMLMLFTNCSNEDSIGDNKKVQSFSNKLLVETKDLPTIQEAWVDAGFMEWQNEEKTMLRVTDLAREQEYLPDVCDGEQLTSAKWMFVSCMKLKKAPMFNTENITDFSKMFMFCESIIEIPKYNVEKGINFDSMFGYCSSLSVLPELIMPDYVYYSMTFNYCISLKEYHFTNQPSGLGNTFSGCKSLEIIDGLDISKGRIDDTAFLGTDALTILEIKGLANTRNYNTLSLKDSKNLSIESLIYIVDNGNNSGNGKFYIQVHPDVYSKIPQYLHNEANNKNFELTDFKGYIDPLGNFDTILKTV